MSQQLIEATKEVIGYTEEAAGSCATCVHAVDEETGIGPTGLLMCRVSNICQFEVRPNGRCRRFEPDTKEAGK